MSVLDLKTVLIPVLVVSVLGLKTVPSLTLGAILIRADREREKCNVSGFLAYFQSPCRQDMDGTLTLPEPGLEPRIPRSLVQYNHLPKPSIVGSVTATAAATIRNTNKRHIYMVRLNV